MGQMTPMRRSKADRQRSLSSSFKQNWNSWMPLYGSEHVRLSFIRNASALWEPPPPRCPGPPLIVLENYLPYAPFSLAPLLSASSKSSWDVERTYQNLLEFSTISLPPLYLIVNERHYLRTRHESIFEYVLWNWLINFFLNISKEIRSYIIGTYYKPYYYITFFIKTQIKSLQIIYRVLDW